LEIPLAETTSTAPTVPTKSSPATLDSTLIRPRSSAPPTFPLDVKTSDVLELRKDNSTGLQLIKHAKPTSHVTMEFTLSDPAQLDNLLQMARAASLQPQQDVEMPVALV
jgi:hypothetical protein